MNSDAHILCVDDEPINLTIYEELLKDQFSLTTVSSGEACIESTSALKPDLILLDVNMPTMNGLETCEALKFSENTCDIPIIFVSALASDAELMAGYEAGGDDYVTKPFNQRILSKKIDVALKNQQLRKNLSQNNHNVTNELQSRLKDVGNLSRLIDFLHTSHSVNSLDLLAQYFFEYLAQFSQDCSLLIISPPDNRFWFSDDIDRPMEKQILESLHGQDRIIKFGSRMAINSEYATVLLRNIPDNEVYLTEIREYAGVLIEGLDVRLKAMETSQFLDDREMVINSTLHKTQAMLAQLSSLERSRHRSLIRAQEKFARDQEADLASLRLTKGQCRQMRQKIERYNKRLLTICQKSPVEDLGFDEVIEQLKNTLQT